MKKVCFSLLPGVLLKRIAGSEDGVRKLKAWTPDKLRVAGCDMNELGGNNTSGMIWCTHCKEECMRGPCLEALGSKMLMCSYLVVCP